jgi:hypothetical protein
MNDREVMQTEALSTDELGDRSYLVHDGNMALVVDPQRLFGSFCSGPAVEPSAQELAE